MQEVDGNWWWCWETCQDWHASAKCPQCGELFEELCVDKDPEKHGFNQKIQAQCEKCKAEFLMVLKPIT